jgi:hypothetical protein
VNAPLQLSTLRGQLTDAGSIRRFIEAGRATLTIRSAGTGTRFTYRFNRPDGDDDQRPIWVSVLAGSDNESSYAYVGTLFAPFGVLRFTAKSKVGPEAPSSKALAWLLRQVYEVDGLRLDQAEVWHEGRCGRCGRKLTVPESIASGFGPECAGRVR